MHFYILLIIN